MSDNKVSLIIPTYNSLLFKTKLTLLSCLEQADVTIEIIIVDDNSENNNFDQISSFLKENNFKDFRLIGSNHNQGTCRNVYNGLKSARYEYVKVIAPGDLFHNEFSLTKWVSFMKEGGVKASFCRNIFYKMEDDKPLPFSNTEIPNYGKCYKSDEYSFSQCRYIYVVMQDYIVGVDCMFKTDTFLYYLGLLLDYSVKYCEDHVIWPMYWDGIGIKLFDEIAMWYEYNVDGITSSTRYQEWKGRLLLDEDNTENILINSHPKSFFLKRLVLLYRIRKTHNRLLKLIGRHLLFPMSIYWWWVMKNNKTLSSEKPNNKFVLKLIEECKQMND